MSSSGRHVHRRRSHSASSPIRGAHLSDDPKWRLAVKRARPCSDYTRSPSYKHLPGADEPPEKWDVDQWRRGKRARRDTARSSLEEQYANPFGATFGSLFVEERTPSLPSMPALPSTSAAFDLFPERTRRKPRRTSHASRLNAPFSHDDDLMTAGELEQMRSHAFGELQRSVAENGEGLVDRMREWENSRHRNDREMRRRQRRRSVQYGSLAAGRATRASEAAAAAAENHDDDDVEIVSGDTGSAPFHIRPLSHKKRALSLDVDMPAIHPALTSDRSSSPLSASAAPSTCASDDEGHTATLFTPALTHAYSNSTNSSLISLPLPIHLQPHDMSPSSSPPFVFPNGAQLVSTAAHVPSPASRSEKAVAALTLAMANGACGLNDYSALHFAEGATTTTVTSPPIDECQVGELWH